MADKDNEARENEPQIDDLPDRDLAQESADAVKGARMRRNNDEDDDLEDLEIQR